MKDNQKEIVGHVLLGFLCVLPVAYAIYAYFRMPLRYVELIAEDNIGETFTAICFLGAGLIALSGTRQRRREGKPWILLALFSAGTLFIGCEELSWFSRFAAFEIDFVQERNRQKEVNLHNMMAGWDLIAYLVAPICLVVYGVLLPMVLPKLSRLRDLQQRWGVPIPPLHSIPLFASAAIFLVMDEYEPFSLNLDKCSEAGEMVFGLGMLFNATVFVTPRDWRNSWRAARTASLALLVALVIVQFGPYEFPSMQRERRLTEFRDWRYINKDLDKPARGLINLDKDCGRLGGLLGNGQAATYNRRLLLHEYFGEPRDRVRRYAALANRHVWADLACTLLNAAVALSYLDEPDEALDCLREAEELLDKKLAESPNNPELLSMKGALLCLKYDADQAMEFLNAEQVIHGLGGFERVKVLQFIQLHKMIAERQITKKVFTEADEDYETKRVKEYGTPVYRPPTQ